MDSALQNRIDEAHKAIDEMLGWAKPGEKTPPAGESAKLMHAMLKQRAAHLRKKIWETQQRINKIEMGEEPDNHRDEAWALRGKGGQMGDELDSLQAISESLPPAQQFRTW